MPEVETPPCDSGKTGIPEDPPILTIIPLSDHYWVGVHARNASNISLCPSTAAAMPLEEEKSGSQINYILVLDLLQNYETGYPK